MSRVTGASQPGKKKQKENGHGSAGEWHKSLLKTHHLPPIRILYSVRSTVS